ncbi:hypothetical protein CIT292_07088 [Citrobacter youngae ATCC 29220]|uniref:Uncharacterized protein n=1 Tax=Citrobacter youngae ATCC 29220 TaxID=500640 RepID=D4B9E9_9ENTR|nr:hypothetical protein CIT292_07088 [Citrobacter youngae ATCC 29220]
MCVFITFPVDLTKIQNPFCRTCCGENSVTLHCVTRENCRPSILHSIVRFRKAPTTRSQLFSLSRTGGLWPRFSPKSLMAAGLVIYFLAEQM